MLLLAGLLPGIALMSIGPVLIPVFFGAKWSQSGALLTAMTPTALALLIVTVLSRIALVYQAQETKVVADVVNLVFPVSMLWLAHEHGWTLTRAVAALSAGAVTAYALYLCLLLLVVERAHSRLARTAVRTGGGPAAFAGEQTDK
jgi:O-antigen/teichoic acid export membrane protein